MKATHVIVYTLLVIGGLNWGLIGIGYYLGHNWNVVAMIFGSIPWLLNLVYVLVGVSAIMSLFCHKKNCKACDKPADSMSGQKM